MATEKATLKVANEQIEKFPAQLAEVVKKVEAEYIGDVECQTTFANIYMDDFNKAKNLVAQAHPDLDLSQIELVIEEDAVSQVVSKSKAQDHDGTEKDDVWCQQGRRRVAGSCAGQLDDANEASADASQL